MKKVLLSLIIVTLNLCSLTLCNLDRNIHNLQNYLHSLPENVSSDNDDWQDSTYIQFYKRSKSTWTDYFLELFNLKKTNPWNIDSVEELLKHVINFKKKITKQEEQYAIFIKTKPETKFVVWGDLYGAAHSLFRCLYYLHKEGTINEKLQIIKPEYYFVFLGNAVNRSPYSLETLQIILFLIKQNPGRVFYLQGKHEQEGYWKNFNLKHEINYRVNRSKVFKKLLTDFFSLLPKALYIKQDDSTNHVICMSNGLVNYKLDQSSIDRYLESSVNSINYEQINEQSSKVNKLEVIAHLKADVDIKGNISWRGLKLSEPFEGATVWSIISSPIEIYQNYADFHYDAFVKLEMNSNIEKSSIQLFSQDIRNKDGFKGGDQLNIVTGQISLKNNSQNNEISLVGSTMSLSRDLRYLGEQIRLGMALLIEKFNKENKVSGNFVKAVVLDDSYKPAEAVNNIEKLLTDYNINTLLLPIGSPTLAAYLDIVKSGKITVLFPVTGSSDFRKPNLKHIVHWRASYQDETRALMEQVLSQRAKKFAFFYQNDAYGLSPLAIAHQILKENGITQWVDIPYSKSAIDLSDAAEKISQSESDAIGLFSTSSITTNLFSKLRIETLYNKKLFGISPLAEQNFKNYIKEKGINVLFAEIVPNPRTSQLEIVKDFRTLMDQGNHEYNSFALEGYISTSLYLQAIKQLKNQASANTILKYFESLKNFSYKGLSFNFNPETRSLGDKVWLAIDEDNWEKYKPEKK